MRTMHLQPISRGHGANRASRVCFQAEREGGGRWPSRDNGPLRVLVVEDEALVAMDLTIAVSDIGGEVVAVAARGEDAVRMAGDLRPDIVLSDVRLAGAMDGIDAARIIRHEFDIPVVFVTGHGDPGTVHRMRAVAPIEPVFKPISLHQLRAAILRAARP